MKGKRALDYFLIRPIYEEILNIKYSIADVSFVHVYKEISMTTNLLPKEEL
jgi:hypothetical protein